MLDDAEEGMEAEAQDALAVSPEAFVEAAVQSGNLVPDLSEDRLASIAQQVMQDHQIDKESMSDWFDQSQRGLDLARMVKEDKTYPHDNASNVKYPLVASAALQFNARAYPAIVPGDRVVKAKVWGQDETGTKAARAERVSEHMSHQLTGPIEEWEESTDKLLMQLPITGTCIRKWWYDRAKGRMCSRLIDPGRFIVNKSVQVLSDAPRVTEELPLYPNEITSRIRSGEFIDFKWQGEDDKDAQQEFLEQHALLDLDGDGYREPYIVTVHPDTHTVVRIVADYEPDSVTYETRSTQVPMLDEMGMMTLVEQVENVKILSIKRGQYFVAFRFMPDPSGGFHGLGLGTLCGDINDTVDTIINQMIDSGAYSLLGGGFVGNNIRLKGASQQFRPGEWKTVNSSGMDIRQAMVPLQFPEPNATMFQMLGLLIEAGREIASVKDVMTGDAGGSQQPATTTLALIEQGMAVFSAAYKRIYLSLKKEFAILARSNQRTVTPEEYAEFHDTPGVDPAEDYRLTDHDIQPVADPRTVTKMQQAAKAQVIMQLADSGLVDRAEALRRMAEALDIEDVEELMPQPDPAQQQMMALQMQAAQADLAEKAAKIELTLAQVDETRASTMEAMAGVQTDQQRLQLEQKKLRMEGLKAILEDERARIQDVLRGAGRVAGKSGDSKAARGNASGSGPAASGAGSDLLVKGLLGGAGNEAPGVRPAG